MIAVCPACGHEDPRPVFVKQGVQHSRCRGCGVVFAAPDRNPNLENALSEYDAAYLQYLSPGPADDANFAAQLTWMRQLGPVTGPLLDIGCGSGKWVRYLRSVGVEAYGLEPSAALARHFLPESDLFATGTVTDDLPITRRTYEVLTAFDVLEHVADPREFLARCAALVRPGGRLYLSTPDVGSAPARLLGRRWHFYNPYHLCLFDRGSVGRLAIASGLRLTHFARRGRLRSVGYVLRYAFDYLLGRPSPAVAARLDRVMVPINLYDTMYCSLRKAVLGEAGLEPAPRSPGKGF